MPDPAPDRLEARRIRKVLVTASTFLASFPVTMEGTPDHARAYGVIDALLDEYAPVLDAGGKLWRREDTTTVLRAVAYAEKGSP